MIELSAQKIATKIKEMNPEETASIEVMKFSLIMIISTLVTLTTSLFLAFLFGVLFETITVLFTFALLRFFSGGFHFKSAELCITATVLGSVILPLISKYTHFSWLLTIISILLLLLFSPRGKNQSRIFEKKHFPLLKIISIVIVGANFLIGSELLALTFFIQSITLLFVKGGEYNV
ncbi:accessory gene regulator ArgB-like protein [Brevibacillus sp. NRS-1366]|uniref:accessory gene regulator ArgB-like protein n=1 Tax=Brevibacillus sp. NRS-1366 TaxID=3233899 RepID=UPI003D1A0B34